jgi:hypothetical protein
MATFVLNRQAHFQPEHPGPTGSNDTSSWKKTCRLSSKALNALQQFHTLFTQLLCHKDQLLLAMLAQASGMPSPLLPLNIWKHLCGTLDKYYSFIMSAQDFQWHALPMAVVTMLMVYQL